MLTNFHAERRQQHVAAAGSIKRLLLQVMKQPINMKYWKIFTHTLTLTVKRPPQVENAFGSSAKIFISIMGKRWGRGTSRCSSVAKRSLDYRVSVLRFSFYSFSITSLSEEHAEKYNSFYNFMFCLQ